MFQGGGRHAWKLHAGRNKQQSTQGTEHGSVRTPLNTHKSENNLWSRVCDCATGGTMLCAKRRFHRYRRRRLQPWGRWHHGWRARRWFKLSECLQQSDSHPGDAAASGYSAAPKACRCRRRAMPSLERSRKPRQRGERRKAEGTVKSEKRILESVRCE